MSAILIKSLRKEISDNQPGVEVESFPKLEAFTPFFLLPKII